MGGPKEEPELERLAREVEVLRERNAALVETIHSNTQLEDFAYGAAHALNGPIRMVTNFVDLLEEEMEGKLEGESKRYMDFVRENTAKMRDMIDTLLRSSRSSGGRPQLSKCPLVDVLNASRASLKEEIIEAGLEIHVEGDLPTLRLDASQMEKVFGVLLKNALLFRSSGAPQLWIGCRKTEKEIQIDFRDNGVGFHAGQGDRVFQLFSTAHNRAEYPGEGAGLAIARRILARHGASISAQGEPGQGATFTLSWPLSADALLAGSKSEAS